MKIIPLTKRPGSETYKERKEAQLHPKARDVISSFPNEVKMKLGKAIFDLQIGIQLKMPLSRAMPSVKSGVEEIRIKDTSGIYRAFYFTKVADKILVFHAFQKKTEKTLHSEIRLAQKRLMEMLNEEI